MSFYEPDHGSTVTDIDLEKFFEENPDFHPLASVGSPSSQSPGDPDVGETEGEGTSSPEPSVTPTEEPTPEPEPETGAPGDGEPGETIDPSAEPDVPPESPEDLIDLEGSRYTRSQLGAAARFQQQLVADPNLQQLITNYLAGEPPSASVPVSSAGEGSAPAEPPPDLDLEDPSVAALYKLVAAQNEKLSQLDYGLRTTAIQQMEQQRQATASIYETAAAQFAKNHELDPNDVENLSRVAARLNVMPQLMEGMDPITGTPVPKDPIKAFDRALEIAMYMVPEYRDREFRRSVATQRQTAEKRKLLGAVGGSSGSTPRTQPAPPPGSPQSRREMVKEVATMLNGNWSDPTAN